MNEPIELVVVDQSEPGSPLELTGKVSVQENLVGNEVVSSLQGDVVARNMSDKTILVLVADFAVNGHHNNNGSHFVADLFFSKNAIPPGDSIPVTGGSAGRQSECCINPLDKGREPKAEFRTLFVQFADGSIFGNPAEPARFALVYAAANRERTGCGCGYRQST